MNSVLVKPADQFISGETTVEREVSGDRSLGNSNALCVAINTLILHTNVPPTTQPRASERFWFTCTAVESPPPPWHKAATCVRAMMIQLFETNISESTITLVADVLRRGRLSEGEKVKALEGQICQRFGVPNAIALNSGTSALHLALVCAGVKPGDEVITTAQTFVATAMVAHYVGARVVFADIEPNTPNIDVRDVSRRVTPRTKAILAVHYGGYPCDMEGLRKVADSCGAALVEDAAHALGATYRNQPIGTFGDYSAFSFQAIKQITSGDGGLLVCRNPEKYREAMRKRWFGIDRANRVPSELGQPFWNITEVGYKYHMNDLAAALALGQLEGFDVAHARRLTLGRHYREALVGIPGLTLLDEEPDRQSSYWLFTVKVDHRLEFIRAMRSRDVEAAVWHQRIDEHSLFGGRRTDLPNQETFNNTQVAIPLRPGLTDSQVQHILDAVKSGW